MKKVLIIVYYFPPCGGVPVIRTYKFAKYLRDFGWDPIILTVKHEHYAFRDDGLLDELPNDLIIYRTKRPWTQAVIRYIQSKGLKESSPSNGNQETQKKENKLYLFLKNFKNSLNRFIFIYDDYIGWKGIALKKIKQILNEHKIDLIFTSSRPYTINVIGNALYKKYQIPWVADFRDPWTQDLRFVRPATFLHQIKIEREERKTVTYANKVVSVSEPMTNFFQQKYQNLDTNKFLTITNGYDSHYDAISTSKTVYKDKFVITYAGSFYLHQTPVWFYQAVKQFLTKCPSARKNFLIQFVGKCQKDYEVYPYKIGLGDVIKKVGFIPHKEVIKYLINSDILLLVLYSNPKVYDFVFSGKFFEYLPAKKPILATLNQGICADFMKKYDLGPMVPFDDINKIAYSINELYTQWQQGQFKYKLMSDKDLLQFHRKNLTAKLVAEFNDVINKK